MRLFGYFLFAFFWINAFAQNEKLLLQLGEDGGNLNPSRYSITDKYNANYNINDLGHGFVISFDRTYAFFNNDLELQWKTTLPKYVKQGPTPLVLGDENKTYIIDFSPSFLAFNKMEVKEINNLDGAVETYELAWKGNESYFADYNLYNGVISILFVSPSAQQHTYRMMVVENRKLTETTVQMPVDATEIGSFISYYNGDNKNGPTLNLRNIYTNYDKKTKTRTLIYKTIHLSPHGKIVNGGVVRHELDISHYENPLYTSMEPIKTVELDGDVYFAGLTADVVPQGFVFGKITKEGKLFDIKVFEDKYPKIVAPIKSPGLTYLPASKTFVLQHYYYRSVGKARLHRNFFDKEGNLICRDEMDVDANLVSSPTEGVIMPTYEERIPLSGCQSFPTNFSYFSLVDNISKQKLDKPIQFHTLTRGNKYIVIAVDPNQGKVTGRTME